AWGLTPTVVDSAHAALTELWLAEETGRPYRLMILDATLPDLEVLAPHTNQQPSPPRPMNTILMVSAADGRPATKGWLEGVARLTKPLKPSELLQALETTRNTAPRKRPAEAELTESREKRTLRILLAEDNAINQQVVLATLEKRGYQVGIAGNGKEVLS